VTSAYALETDAIRALATFHDLVALYDVERAVPSVTDEVDGGAANGDDAHATAWTRSPVTPDRLGSIDLHVHGTSLLTPQHAEPPEQWQFTPSGADG
jgi:hypothetical protein